MEESQKGINSYDAKKFISFSGDFNAQLVAGIDIPDELKEYFFGIDEEMQLSNLPENLLKYGASYIEYVNALKFLAVTARTEAEQAFFLSEINKENLKHKYLVRGFRGKDGFTIKELNSFSQNITQTNTENNKPRSILSRWGK